MAPKHTSGGQGPLNEEGSLQVSCSRGAGGTVGIEHVTKERGNMDANTRKLERIFDQTVTYQVPLFQRPYVWTNENWELLWDDIQSLLDKHLRGVEVHPHFLGAVVLEQLPNPSGSIEARQVIDGQQRFTTLQLFLMAARDHATTHGNLKYIERFSDLVANKRSKIDHDDEMFKVWPTNSDRAAFRLVHQAGSLDAVKKGAKGNADFNEEHNIVAAYQYFYSQLELWLAGSMDDADDAEALSGKDFEGRLESLWQVVKECLQLVVIDLDKDDETQVIFETLNARGTDLLPADLLKNFLFRRALANKEDVKRLNTKFWQGFETEFWRQEIKQGRLFRPRIDIFISHYLTMMTLDEVRSAHLFNTFKNFVVRGKPTPGSSVPFPTTATEHIEQLAKYAHVFRVFYEPGNHPRLKTFLRRLEAVDTATVYPFLLHAYAELMPEQQEEFDKLLGVLESFLMRRLICNLTPKNYNRFFVDLLKAVEKSAGGVTADNVETFLRKSTSVTSRYPDNNELRTAIFSQGLYDRLAQYKVRAVLEALDAAAYTTKSEAIALPDGLTIEHVMPQTWETHWPLPAEMKKDPLEAKRAGDRRSMMLNTLGNLTLITGSLNPALSNSKWTIKRPELLKFAKLNLTQYFHGPDAEVWDEAAIEKRTTHLYGQLEKIWP